MPFTYKKQTAPAPKASETPKADNAQFGAVPMSALRDAMKSPASMGGRKVDLASAMREKMESAFGMDFSALSVYESPMVAQAGANAVADGSAIAFAPGKFDQSSQGGQALLGHELSHIAAQARGEVRGGGFLDNGALEARADREGAQAAAGETVYDGDFAAPSASLAPVAAAPMQANRSNIDPKEFQDFIRKQRMGKDLDRALAFRRSGIQFTGRGELEQLPQELVDSLGGREQAEQVAAQENQWYENFLKTQGTPEMFDMITERTRGLMGTINQKYDDAMQAHAPTTAGNTPLGPRGRGAEGRRQMEAAKEASRKLQAEQGLQKMKAGFSDEAADLLEYQQMLYELAPDSTTMGFKAANAWVDKVAQSQEEQNSNPALKEMQRKNADIMAQRRDEENPVLNGKLNANAFEKSKVLTARRKGMQATKASGVNMFLDNLRKEHR